MTNIIDVLEYVEDALGELESYCRPGRELTVVNPVVARHLLLLVGRLRSAMRTVSTAVEGDPPTAPVQKDHRLTVRWLGPQYACVGLGVTGRLVQRQGAGPWRVLHEGPVSQEQAQAYVDSLPGKWVKHNTAQVFHGPENR